MTTPDRQDLKPCPFCGGEVELRPKGQMVVIACQAGSACEGSGLGNYILKSQVKTAITAWNTRPTETRLTQERDRLASILKGAPNLLASDCDGIEQDAFEYWADSERYDMETHPIHWLFLEQRTAAARAGWKAGLQHASDRARTTLASIEEQAK